MYTYLILNCIFMLVAFLVFRYKTNTANIYALIALLIMTALFDQIIIGLGIVSYDTDKILGLYIGLAPIEDFFYCLGAVIIVGTLWKKLNK